MINKKIVWNKKNTFLSGMIYFLLVFLFPIVPLQAQILNRLQMKGNILSNIYQNANHAVTGQTLQNVLINQTYSYINLKSDSNFLSLFDTGYTYYRGMSVLTMGDSIYRCVAYTHHGPWDSIDFRFVEKMNGGEPGGHDGDIQFNKGGGFWGDDLLQYRGGSLMLGSGIGISLTPGNGIYFDGVSDALWRLRKVSGMGDGIIGSNNELGITFPNTSEGFSINNSMTYSLFQVSGNGNFYFRGNMVDALSGVIMSPLSRSLSDHSSIQSIDWDNRFLVNSGGAYLSWANGLHPATNGDIVTKGYADSVYKYLAIQDVVPTDGGTVNSDGSVKLALNSPGTLSSLTIVFPNSPVNGQQFGIISTQTISIVTLNAGTGGAVIISTSIGLTEYASYNWYYDALQNTWLIW